MNTLKNRHIEAPRVSHVEMLVARLKLKVQTTLINYRQEVQQSLIQHKNEMYRIHGPLPVDRKCFRLTTRGWVLSEPKDDIFHIHPDATEFEKNDRKQLVEALYLNMIDPIREQDVDMLLAS